MLIVPGLISWLTLEVRAPWKLVLVACHRFQRIQADPLCLPEILISWQATGSGFELPTSGAWWPRALQHSGLHHCTTKQAFLSSFSAYFYVSVPGLVFCSRLFVRNSQHHLLDSLLPNWTDYSYNLRSRTYDFKLTCYHDSSTFIDKMLFRNYLGIQTLLICCNTPLYNFM